MGANSVISERMARKAKNLATADNNTTFERYRQFVNPHLARLVSAVGLECDFVRGEGTRLWDRDGKVYLDFIAGFGSVPFGHNPPFLNDVLKSIAEDDQPYLVQPILSDAATVLAEKLVKMAPDGLRHVTFANSGAEAVEAALKACRMETGRDRIVAASLSFHGKTMGALSVTDSQRRDLYPGPAGSAQDLIPFGDAQALEDYLKAHKGETAAVILEPVQGEGGVNAATKEYLQDVRRLCDAHDVRLILDEVQTGFGRTGHIFTSDWAEITPDCLVLAKALGGGIAPIGVCLHGARAYSQDFALQHSSTFGGNYLAARLALATVEHFETQGDAILANVRERSRQLQEIHDRLRQDFPSIVGGDKGMGLLLGLEVELELNEFNGRHGQLSATLSEQGNLIPLIAGYLFRVEGIRTAPTLRAQNVLRVEPPLTVTAEECERYAEAMERTLNVVSARDTGALLRCLLPEGRGDAAFRPINVRHSRHNLDAEAEEGESRFAFVVNVLKPTNYADYDESLRCFVDEDLGYLTDRLADHMDPFLLSRVRFRSPSGASAIGDFICLPHTSEGLLELDQSDALGYVQDAIDTAKRRGAKYIGLGAYTSIVTRGGLDVLDDSLVMTSGGAYTVLAAIEALELGCHKLSIDPTTSQFGVVGAAGLIGSAVFGLIAGMAGRVRLVTNPRTATSKNLRRLSRQVASLLTDPEYGDRPVQPGSALDLMLRHPKCPPSDASFDEFVAYGQDLVTGGVEGSPLAWDPESKASLSDCAALVVATSDTNEIISPEAVLPGGIVCDLSKPPNISKRFMDERDDVLVIDGGTVNLPGRPDIGFQLGLPRGVGYACMAETIMLSLEKHPHNTSIGSKIDKDNLSLVSRLAKRHGVSLSDLRSFDLPVTDADWRRVRDFGRNKDRPVSGPPRNSTEPAGLTVRRPQAPESFSDEDLLNIAERMVDRHVAAGHGQKCAVIEGDRRLDYETLQRRSHVAARALRDRGVGQGARVVFVSEDSIDAVAVALGAWRLGACVGFLNPSTPTSALNDLIASADAALVLVSDKYEAMLSDGTLTAIESGPLPLRSIVGEDHAGEAVDAKPVPGDTPAIFLFSSGSTGEPKMIEHTHKTVANTSINYADAILEITGDDILFSTSRLFFAYGFNSLHMALQAGGSVVLAPEQPKPEAVFRLLEAHKPTIFFAVPTIYHLLLRQSDDAPDLSSVRDCVSAGEPLPEDIFDVWQDRFGHSIIDGIGTTEVLSTFISNTAKDLTIGSTGRVVPGFEIRLITDEGVAAKVGEIGRLWVRGNTVVRGYSNDPELNASVFDDGWFCTNDMMYRDDYGQFYFVGRANDMLKVGGVWVSPQEIEVELMKNPSVEECAVVARSEIGLLKQIVAFVVPAKGAEPGDELAEALKADVKERLLPGRYPHFIKFVEALPRTATNKVQRFKLRAD